MIKVTRLRKIEGYEKVKGFCDISYHDVKIKGLRIINGSNGLFVAMPREKGKDGKFYDTVEVLDAQTKLDIERIVLDLYHQEGGNTSEVKS